MTLQINCASERVNNMEHTRNDIKKSLAVIAGVIGLSASGHVLGQSVGVGFAPIDVPQGFSLLANPLASGANRVQDLITNAPDGFELIKLSGGVWQTNRFTADPGSWSIPEMTLSPGEGALASSPEAFAWNRVGKPVTGMLENFVPEGESLRSSILPLTGLISTDLGFPTIEGLTISTANEQGEFSVVATYESGAWQPEEPVLSIGRSVLVTTPSASVWNKDFVLSDDDNPLVISEQPQGASLNEGDPFSLSVVASGANALSYQWQQNGNDIEGATESSYAVTQSVGADAGSYSVIVFTPTHSIRSQQANVEVIVPEPEPEPEPEPPVVTPPADGLSVISRLGQDDDGLFLEAVISGEPGQLVSVEVSRTADGTRWRRRATDLPIGEDGQVVHSERVSGESLFVRVIPQVPEPPAEDPPAEEAPAAE